MEAVWPLGSCLKSCQSELEWCLVQDSLFPTIEARLLSTVPRVLWILWCGSRRLSSWVWLLVVLLLINLRVALSLPASACRPSGGYLKGLCPPLEFPLCSSPFAYSLLPALTTLCSLDWGSVSSTQESSGLCLASFYVCHSLEALEVVSQSRLGALLVCCLSLTGYWPSLPDVQCLENHCSCILPGFWVFLVF